jgi:hypothetical protein
MVDVVASGIALPQAAIRDRVRLVVLPDLDVDFECNAPTREVVSVSSEDEG